jgi:hypothetical protein
MTAIVRPGHHRHQRLEMTRSPVRDDIFTESLRGLSARWCAEARDTTAVRAGDDLSARRRNSPWYASKAEPSTSDMTALLRRVLIAARLKSPRPDQTTCEELHAIRLAWEEAAA